MVLIIIFSKQYTMRTHRGKQYDWTKPFKLIDSKQIFDDLDTAENQLVISFNSKPEPEAAPITKKQQIIVPKIQIVNRITEPKEFAQTDANYHRLTNELNLPKLIHYELNEVDHVFLQGHSNRFKFEGKTVLTAEFLSKAFIELELKAGKDPVLPRTKSWMINYLQREYTELNKWPLLEQFAELFYNYWKNRREELKFPMLRSLWRPNPDEYNHLLAFKPRQKEKRNLRRTNRLAEDEIANELEEEFCLALKIVERVKAREELKLKQLDFQLQNFHNEYKGIFGRQSFFNEINGENRSKDKEKLKKLQQEVQQVKKIQIQEEMQFENENQDNQTFDQKLSMVEFLSTVIHSAEQYGIFYDKVFSDKNIGRPTHPPPQTHVPDNVSYLPKEEKVQVEKAQLFKLRLFQQKETIFRTLQQQDENEYYEKIPTNYFDYLREEIKCYYFGEDDEGDFKDLKKNISQSYKKFQQMNKLMTEGA